MPHISLLPKVTKSSLRNQPLSPEDAAHVKRYNWHSKKNQEVLGNAVKVGAELKEKSKKQKQDETQSNFRKRFNYHLNNIVKNYEKLKIL